MKRLGFRSKLKQISGSGSKYNVSGSTTVKITLFITENQLWNFFEVVPVRYWALKEENLSNRIPHLGCLYSLTSSSTSRCMVISLTWMRHSSPKGSPCCTCINMEPIGIRGERCELCGKQRLHPFKNQDKARHE